MKDSFRESGDFTRPTVYMGAADLGNQYRLLDSQLRKRPVNPGAVVDTMIILVQQSAGTDAAKKAFERTLAALLKTPDEHTRRRIESFELFMQPGSELDVLRVAALAKLPSAPAPEDPAHH